jgi:hypothetical protein
MSETEFLDGLARLQQGIHEAGGWEHSLLLLVRPAVGEAGVVHVDQAQRVWVGSTSAVGHIERLRRAAGTITSSAEADITELVAAFEPEGAKRVDVRQLMGFHAESAGRGSDAAIALFLVRDAEGEVSMTTKWQDGKTTFIEEPLGYTDALIAEAAGYAAEPWLETRGMKGPLHLSPARSDSRRRRGPSALLRYLRVELPDEVTMIEPFDDWLAQQDAPVQVFAWTWARLATGLRSTPDAIGDDERADDFLEFMDAVAQDQSDYMPEMDDVDPGGNPVPDVVGAQLGGIWKDLTDDEDDEPVPRLNELINAALSAVQMFNRASPRWGLAYDVSVGHLAMIGIGRVYDDLLSAAMLSPAFVDLQRLWWVAECISRKGIALSGSHAPAFPADEMECVRLLCRMAANQPTLAAGAALQRQVPLRADRWMSLTDRSRRAIEELDLPEDRELVDRLAHEIKAGRHFALDHVAIIELDEMNMNRIVLAPEERADDGANLGLIGLLEHRRGTFVVSCTVPVKTAEQSPSRLPQDSAPTALTFAPAFMQEMMGEGASAIELMMLSAWRDLVVADVREQQYEQDVVRRAKGKARKGRTTEVVRYLPRRVALRRAERAAREATGEPALRRLYPVGAYAKRLPKGQKRSAEAEAYAAKIGMPLAEHQTVVQPHWRGGTEEDRRAAAEAADAPTRVWRSWSALDLLRTRRRGGSNGD